MSGKRSIGSIIRQLRVENHMTQEQLAKALGVRKSAISMYESGRRQPTLERLEKLTDIFNVDVSYFCGQSDLRNERLNGDRYVQIPICSRIIPGTDFWKDPGNILDHLAIPTVLLKERIPCFAVRGSDPCLAGSGFHPDDLLIFRISGKIQEGQRGLFCSRSRHRTVFRQALMSDAGIYAEEAAEHALLKTAAQRRIDEDCIAVLVRMLSSDEDSGRH